MRWTRRRAALARRHARVLIDWREVVARGARIGRTARTVDLPRRYRENPRWVIRHVWAHEINQQVRLFGNTIDSTEVRGDDHEERDRVR